MGPVHRLCAWGWNASFAFDMSIKDLRSLLSGHCLVVIPQEVRASGARMVAFVERERVDAFDITPSQLQPMIAEGCWKEEERNGSCCWGGRRWTRCCGLQMKNCDGIDFHNMYGPTECTVDANDWSGWSRG